jgi:GGDEF domain-containing protein
MPDYSTGNTRNGDRIILLFTDLLKEYQNRKKVFIGHIGGDDFFLGLSLYDHSFSESMEIISEIVYRFQGDVKSFYNKIDRVQGYISAKSRSGRITKYPLLTVSASVLAFGEDGANLSLEEFGTKFADLKGVAKKKKKKIAVRSIGIQQVLGNEEIFVHG